MTGKFIDKVYGTSGDNALKEFYDAWSTTYDAEVEDGGYATPDRCAAALAQFAPDKSAPVLDFGCGTGLSGQALHRAGFTAIDGIDISEEMIAQAQAKSVYRKLTQTTAGAAVPGGYSLISAIGVIGAGAAPVETLGTLMQALPRTGLIVLSFNDHTLAEPGSMGYLNEWLDCGAARLLFSEHGPHLPAHNMNATVFVIEKL